MNDGLLRLVDGVRLTPTQRRIAQCLLERPDAAFLSSSEVAELARVSQPSVTRFAMALGFDGYPALRRSLRDPVPSGHGYPTRNAPWPGTAHGAGRAHEVGGAHRAGDTLTTAGAGDADGPGGAGDADKTDGTGDAGGTREAGDAGKTGGAGAGLARETGATDPAGQGWPPRNELQHAIDGELDSLGRLAERLAEGTADRAAIAAASAALIRSPALPVLGLRAAAPMANYFGYFAAKIHPDVRIFDQGGSLLHDRIDQALAAGATAMLAIVLPRYPREALGALDVARAAGLSLVVLTDSPISPAAALANVTLSAAVGARLVFDLHVAPMALAMVLLQAMCDAAPADTQARLEQFESSAARRHVFVR